MAKHETVSATEFKAKCLDLFDRLTAREVERIEITKRGRIVAVVRAPEATEDAIGRLHGWQRGAVCLPPDLDLTAPILDEPWIEDERQSHD